MAAQVRIVWTLMRRGLNEIARVPGAMIPGVIAPTLFLLGLTAVFGKLTVLPGFTTRSFMSFLMPVSMLQSATFSGAATGVNLARDIELGWFDRMLVAPAARGTLLAGIVLSAGLRVLFPLAFLFIVAFALGAHFPGAGGLALGLLLAVTFAAAAAAWTTSLALRFKTQQAAPLMQASMFMLVLFTTSYAPQHLLTGWLYHVARYNPMTKVVEAVRQGFVSHVTWGTTWPGLVALAGIATVFGALALRSLARAGR